MHRGKFRIGQTRVSPRLLRHFRSRKIGVELPIQLSDVEFGFHCHQIDVIGLGFHGVIGALRGHLFERHVSRRTNMTDRDVGHRPDAGQRIPRAVVRGRRDDFPGTQLRAHEAQGRPQQLQEALRRGPAYEHLGDHRIVRIDRTGELGNVRDLLLARSAATLELQRQVLGLLLNGGVDLSGAVGLAVIRNAVGAEDHPREEQPDAERSDDHEHDLLHMVLAEPSDFA